MTKLAGSDSPTTNLSASGMFGAVKEWKSEQSRRSNCSHLLAVSGLIHKRATIEQLSFGFMEALRTLISRCQSKDSQGYTPSDFAAARLNQQQLDKFLSKVNKDKTKR